MSSIDWDYIAACAGDAPMTPEYHKRMLHDEAIAEARERNARMLREGKVQEPSNRDAAPHTAQLSALRPRLGAATGQVGRLPKLTLVPAHTPATAPLETADD